MESNGIRRKRKKSYSQETEDALVKVWELFNRICSKRLVPFLSIFCQALQKHGHLNIADSVRDDLLRLSPATIDRCLAPLSNLEDQKKRRFRHRSPGIRRQIPIRTFSEWGNALPGNCEIDLVAHCGTSMRGSFLYSFVLTDVATGWTESLPLLSRHQESLLAALLYVTPQFPFPLISLDSDNGKEFINGLLIKYCRENSLGFTRSRPYRKNDQCFIEQKNGQVIRRNFGYDRLDGLDAFSSLNDLYKILRLYNNFFQPPLKLLYKTSNGVKIKRKYDLAQTPYQRVMSSISISNEIKERLRLQYDSLDPMLLLQKLQMAQDKLWFEPQIKQIPVVEKINNSLLELNLNSRALEESRSCSKDRNWRQAKRPYKKNSQPRWWKSRKDPFQFVWSTIVSWLEENSDQTAKEILQKLEENLFRYPMQLLSCFQIPCEWVAER